MIDPAHGIISGTTIVGNHAETAGGGIVAGGALAITNSTISGNTATTGAAIVSATPELTVTNGTITGNNASIDGGALLVSEQGTYLRNTIVAGNTGGNCGGVAIDDAGYNLDDGTTCAFSAATSQSSSDPMLDPAGLQDNGGPPLTIALAGGSPAIDAIPAGANGCGDPIDADQRDVARPLGAGCDIGAFETTGFSFTGFFAPIRSGLNETKAGRAVPVKFSLAGNQGLDIFAAGSPTSELIACDLSSGISDVTETVTAGGSSLAYDATTDQYTYVWKTQKDWAGTCRRLVLRFTDGQEQTADFHFTR
jgi:hypothetical protein